MNKRIKKKRWLEMRLAESLASEHLLLQAVTDQNGQLADLRRANNLQQEVIEDYGRQLGDLKRRVADLERVGGANVLACNNRFDQLEADNKALREELERARKPFWKKR